MSKNFIVNDTSVLIQDRLVDRNRRDLINLSATSDMITLLSVLAKGASIPEISTSISVLLRLLILKSSSRSKVSGSKPLSIAIVAKLPAYSTSVF